MFKKFIKLTLVLLILHQIGHYFYLKHTLSDSVVTRLESRNCLGYESFGMDLPISIFFKTKTIGTVYLKNKDYPNSIDLKVEIIDTAVPLFKGIFKFRWRLRTEEIRNNFSHCYEFKTT